MGTDSLAENTLNTTKFIRSFCPVGLINLRFDEKRLHWSPVVCGLAQVRNEIQSTLIKILVMLGVR